MGLLLCTLIAVRTGVETNYFVIACVAFFAAIAGVLAALVAISQSAIGFGAQEDEATRHPLELVDAFSCKKGLNAIKIVRGIPDNFDRTHTEATFPREALLSLPYMTDENGDLLYNFGRQYDQGGADLQLIDHFVVPRGIVSGALFIGLKPAAENSNDNISMSDREAGLKAPDPASLPFQASVSASEWDAHRIEGTDHLYSFDIEKFTTSRGPKNLQSLRAYFNDPDRANEVDLQVVDDTIVDFAALLLCQEPEEALATTFYEHSSKFLGEELSYLSCAGERTKRACNPYQGDRSCAVPTPIACYKNGTRKVPTKMLGEEQIMSASFVGGEVKVSEPVRGDSFAELDQADAYCESQFGEGWRVLEFNESGNAAAMSYSNIPVDTVMIVNVSNQPYANCWDRPGTADGQE